MSPDRLVPPDYTLVAEMTHASLAEFVIENFLRRPTWVTRAHHAMTIATIAAIVYAAVATHRSWRLCVLDFFLALAALVVVILPLHELLHALGYRITGARDIRWDYSTKMFAVWVIAHRFVATTRPFVFVALLPFVVINAALIVAAFVISKYAVFFLFVLLWHIHGAIGDWSLLNFIWRNRARGFWTFDDADAGKSYFFGRAEV